MRTLLEDLRFAARQMRKKPAFALTTVLILAIGIGASTAIFSAVNPILFEPLPYPQAKRIVMIWDIFQGDRNPITFHTYREIAERNHAFESVAVMQSWRPALTGTPQPERLSGQSVSFEFFRTLGVQPSMGRDFVADDDVFNGRRVVILSDRMWRQHFQGDAAIVGKQVRLEDDLYTVIGVMPNSFVNVLNPTAELWTTLRYDTVHVTNFDSSEWGHHLNMIGRLRPTVSLQRALDDLNGIAHSPVPEFVRPPHAALRQGLMLKQLQAEVTRGVKPALLAVIGAVGLLLLIACVNVTNLILARGMQRQGEFAVRSALGAGRRRLIRQLITESFVLSASAGVIAMLVAQLGVRALVALSPPNLPRIDAIRMDATVFAFTAAIATLVGVLVGTIPGVQLFRRDAGPRMQQSTGRTTARHEWTRRTLVVAEIALALVLMVCAGLLLHSLQKLFSVDPGFQADHLLTMEVQTSGHRYDDDAAKVRFFEQALQAVQHVPGVTSAGFTSLLPLSGEQYGVYGLHLEGEAQGHNVYRYAVNPGYFGAAGIRLERGRLLNDDDRAGTPHVAVVSESLAKRHFPGENAIGKRIHVGPTVGEPFTIVGVVGDVIQGSMAESDPKAVYLTPQQSWFVDDAMSLAVRTSGDPALLVPAVKNAIWSVDKDQPIVRVATMNELLATSEAQRRFALVVFEAFAMVGLLLAMTGIYGVLSGSVTERTREIGIRAALGASRGDLLTLVVRQGMTLAAAGIVIGLTGAALASRAIATLLFGVSRLDPAIYLAGVGLLLVVSGIACWAPAWRAARVDPAITLRAE